MKFPRFLLLMFFLFMTAHICRPFIYSFTSLDIKQYWCIPALIFLMLAVKSYSSRCLPSTVIPTFTAKVLMLFLAIIFLCLYGIFRGNFLTYIFTDAWILMVILCFLVLGRYDQPWYDMEKPLIILFWIGFAMVLVGLFRPEVMISTWGVDVSTEKDQASSATLGYDVQFLLSFWPICFALAYFRPRMDKWRILGLGTAVAYLALQIYFLKRAPSARVFAYVITIVFVAAIVHARPVSWTTILLITAFVVIAGTMVSTEALLRRFKEAERTSRFSEAWALLDDLSGAEVLIGRGMGGYFKPPEGWRAGLAVVNKNGEMGRTGVHIGACIPYLKGGLLLFLLNLSFVVPMFRRKGSEWYTDRLNLAAISTLPVWLLFQLTEGSPSLGAPYDAIIFGFACARMSVVSSGQDTSIEFADDGYDSDDAPLPLDEVVCET